MVTIFVYDLLIVAGHCSSSIFHISSYFADPDRKSLSDNLGILDGKSNSSFNYTILSHCISLVDFLHLHLEHQQIALKVMAEQPHRLKFAHM